MRKKPKQFTLQAEANDISNDTKYLENAKKTIMISTCSEKKKVAQIKKIKKEIKKDIRLCLTSVIYRQDKKISMINKEIRLESKRITSERRS